MRIHNSVKLSSGRGICSCTMSSAKEANLSALYAELNKYGQNAEYERALKTANKSEALCVIAWSYFRTVIDITSTFIFQLNDNYLRM